MKPTSESGMGAFGIIAIVLVVLIGVVGVMAAGGFMQRFREGAGTEAGHSWPKPAAQKTRITGGGKLADVKVRRFYYSYVRAKATGNISELTALRSAEAGYVSPELASEIEQTTTTDPVVCVEGVPQNLEFWREGEDSRTTSIEVKGMEQGSQRPSLSRVLVRNKDGRILAIQCAS